MLSFDYDIFSSDEFSIFEPRFDYFRERDVILKENIERLSKVTPGFIKSKLTSFEALWACRLLQACGVSTWPLSANYADASIGFEEMDQIAHGRWLKICEREPELKLEAPVRMESQYPLRVMVGSYMLARAESDVDKRLPRGRVLTIDRRTGELWDQRTWDEWSLRMELLRGYVPQTPTGAPAISPRT